MKQAPPEGGVVEVLTGVMGAGKSLHAVDTMLDVIRLRHRPVFTNMPVKHRVLRRYLELKSGPQFANLVYPLTLEHFKRFMDRQHLRMEFLDELRAQAAHRGEPFGMTRAYAEFDKKHGPAIYRGPDANDVYIGSYVMLDEFHHWYGSEAGKDADAELRRYLTMCRHHLHNVVVITQNPMFVTVTLRRLVSKYTICSRMDVQKFGFGMTFGSVGVKMVVRKSYAASDLYNGEVRADAEPIDTKVIRLRSARAQVLFRLYHSHVHVGSARRLLSALDRVREDHGITDLLEQERFAAIERRKGRTVRVGKTIAKGTRRVALVACVAAAGAAIGYALERPDQVDQVTNSLSVPADIRVLGYSRGRVKIGEGWYGEGDSFYGAQVLRVARDGLVCLLDDRVFAFTGDRLLDLGPADLVIDRAVGIASERP